MRIVGGSDASPCLLHNKLLGKGGSKGHLRGDAPQSTWSCKLRDFWSTHYLETVIMLQSQCAYRPAVGGAVAC